jgi:very-short-patch-repair endonuclease
MSKDLDYLKIEGMFAGATPDTRKFARKLRASQTDSEAKLWSYLKTKPLGFKFRRQHPFNLYVLDFYCHKLRLAIEIDGEYHNTQQQQKMDLIRTTSISKYNVDVIRFTNHNIMEDLHNTTKKINRIIEKRSEDRINH